jgi:hypothetical protein
MPIDALDLLFRCQREDLRQKLLLLAGKEQIKSQQNNHHPSGFHNIRKSHLVQTCARQPEHALSQNVDKCIWSLLWLVFKDEIDALLAVDTLALSEAEEW